MSSTAAYNVVVMVILQFFVYLLVVSAQDINPAYAGLSNTGSYLSSFNDGTSSEPVLSFDDVGNQLPVGEGSIDPTTGLVFTDVFSSIKNWILGTTGISQIYVFLTSPYYLLKASHLNNTIAFAVGTLWYSFGLFQIVLLLWGRD